MSKCLELYKGIEDYKLILKHINFDLKDINFVDDMGLKLGLAVSDVEKKEDENILILSVSTDISACDKENEDIEFFYINIVYNINIKMDENLNIDIKNKIISANITDHALRLLHPELRVMANSIVNRIGLPNIDIPLEAMKSNGNTN